MSFFILWILCSIIVAIIAKFLNHSALASFLMALIISPLLAIIILLLRKKGKSEQEIRQDEVNQQQTEILKGQFMAKYRMNSNQYHDNKMLTDLFNKLNGGKQVDHQVIQTALNNM